MGFLGGIIGTLTGVDQIAGAISGGGGGSNERPITSFCPATPPGKVDAIIRAMTANPNEVQSARGVIEAWARGGGKARDRDMAKVRTIWDSTQGMASALVWLAWGGGDCVIGSGDIPLQSEANRIAARDPGVTSPVDGSPLSTTAPAGALSPETGKRLITGLAIAAAIGAVLILVFAFKRKHG